MPSRLGPVDKSKISVEASSGLGCIVNWEIGKVGITATTEEGNFTAACTVTVTNQPVAVSGVELDSKLSVSVGSSKTLTAKVLPSNATNQKVTWESSDPTVAKVDENGRVTAIAEGTATITVTTEDGGYAATCEVTVTERSGDDAWISGGTVISGLGGDGMVFTDVTFRNYYYNAVKWAVDRGITAGTSRYTFSPDAACTRAQIVTFLYRAR